MCDFHVPSTHLSPSLLHFSPAWQSRGSRCKASPSGHSLSVTCFSLIPSSLLFPPCQHMLSPQKAPERLLQLADSNLESLIVEMDQLHSRVWKQSRLVCPPFLSFFFFSLLSHGKKRQREADVLHAAGLRVTGSEILHWHFSCHLTIGKMVKLNLWVSDGALMLCTWKLQQLVSESSWHKHVSSILWGKRENAKSEKIFSLPSDHHQFMIYT